MRLSPARDSGQLLIPGRRVDLVEEAGERIGFTASNLDRYGCRDLTYGRLSARERAVRFWIPAAAAAALTASFLLTLVIKRTAGRLGLIDVPNERSSHALPMPRGGGVAIAIASLAAMGLLSILGIMPPHLFLAIAPGGAAVAAVGLIDD